MPICVREIRNMGEPMRVIGGYLDTLPGVRGGRWLVGEGESRMGKKNI